MLYVELKSEYDLYNHLVDIGHKRFTLWGCEAILDLYEDYDEEFDWGKISCFCEYGEHTEFEDEVLDFKDLLFDYRNECIDFDQWQEENPGGELGEYIEEVMVPALNERYFAVLLGNGNVLVSM